ncbi:uncharacterized protein LOC103650229 precursor [Zea mays]|uniref:uncharacterized protein LOC103650229 precursor n=1 Tax=Zea mays TaxID=4577 RepID=UPI000221B31B|nr:uncharacterized protein LOC103650229 precursor [Zea mays]
MSGALLPSAAPLLLFILAAEFLLPRHVALSPLSSLPCALVARLPASAPAPSALSLTRALSASLHAAVRSPAPMCSPCARVAAPWELLLPSWSSHGQLPPFCRAPIFPLLRSFPAPARPCLLYAVVGVSQRISTSPLL